MIAVVVGWLVVGAIICAVMGATGEPEADEKLIAVLLAPLLAFGAVVFGALWLVGTAGAWIGRKVAGR